MNNNRQWMSSVDLSLLTPRVSLLSNLSESKSKFWLAPESQALLSTYFARWAQANIRKGQAGIEPKDVYGTRV